MDFPQGSLGLRDKPKIENTREQKVFSFSPNALPLWLETLSSDSSGRGPLSWNSYCKQISSSSLPLMPPKSSQDTWEVASTLLGVAMQWSGRTHLSSCSSP
jgi:hypothetical protein